MRGIPFPVLCHPCHARLTACGLSSRRPGFCQLLQVPCPQCHSGQTQLPLTTQAFVAAGIKPLSARDAFLCAKAIEASLVASDFNAWGVAKQALGPYRPQFVPSSAPTYFRSLLISVSFARHLLGLVVLDFTLDSGRIRGLANAHYSARCAVKRRPALTVAQVTFLEGIVWNDARKIADRIAAGCFLLMVYGRLRFSDMQRTVKLVIDSVLLDDGSEVGYLEGQAERTKTSISLERKVRALPIAVPLKSVSVKP